MRWIARAFALPAITTLLAIPAFPTFAVSAVPVPVIVVDGKGHGHGVGMAQDGALAMGKVGATTKAILNQFYPGTTIGKASGPVRVPVLNGNSIELGFPDGGEIRGYPAASNPPGATLPIRFAPGARALVYRDGDATRVRTLPPSTAAATTTTSTPSTTAPATTTTTLGVATTTTTLGLIPQAGQGAASPEATPVVPASSTTTTTSSAPTTATTTPPVALIAGMVTAAPTGDGRVDVTPRHHRYRGVVEMTPTGGGLRFVNQVPIETYLRGMGEVRNPSWPAASLQAQAIAARTYAMRAMTAGGELCDTQRCQVYLGADAEYREMDKAVTATAGQVLMFGNALASAVYSANGGGHSASRAEGFGVESTSAPYLRAAAYLSDDLAPWTVTISLLDVARRVNYRGTIDDVQVAERGPSGRATRITLTGSNGAMDVTGLAFDAALGLNSTLFSVRITTATDVAALNGESTLQAPPELAPGLADGHVATAAELGAKSPRAVTPSPPKAGLGFVGFAGVIFLAGASLLVGMSRRRARDWWHGELS